MNVEIRKSKTFPDGAYDLIVNGEIVMEGQSHGVVDRVADNLRGFQYCDEYSEIDEVADSIRNKVA